MNSSYRDITSRIEQKPVWWDEHAVPRYDPFHPDLLADIYATEAALVAIECQGCHTPFEVAFAWGPMDMVSGRRLDLAARAEARSLAYGDPPNTGCCPAGGSMNSTPRKVLQFWRHRDTEEEGFSWEHPWVREESFEGIDLTPDWATEEPAP